MRNYLRAGLIPAFLLLLGGAVRAEVKDPAELFPANTLAYAELHQPDKVAKELAALVKGSMVENMPLTMAKLRAQLNDRDHFWIFESVATFGMFLSPEILNESGRLQGAAIGLTGFTKNNEPEIVGFILAGQSYAPTFVLRTVLTLSETRLVGEVEKIPLFRNYGRDYSEFRAVKPGEEPKEPEIKFYGPTLALLPDAIVIGSTTESVKEVVSRYAAKNTTPSLASTAAFKDAAKLRDRPGLFGYADVNALLTQAEGPQKKALGLTDYQLSVFNAIVNKKALKTMAASLTLSNGDLDLRVSLNLDPKEKSPILELLSDQGTNLEVLHSAGRNSLFSVAMNFPDGEKRWEKIVALADAIAKATDKPEELWPSKVVSGAEKKFGVKFGKDLFGQIKGIAVSMDVDKLKSKEPPVPTLSILANDEAGAKKIETHLPKLLAMVGWDSDDGPKTDTIQGYKVQTIEDQRRGAIHYGRQGTVLVVGLQRINVAEGLQGWDKKGGVLGQARVAETLKKREGAMAVGTWSLGETLTHLFGEMGGFASREPFEERFPGSGSKPEKKPEKNPLDKYVKEMNKAIETIPPATVSLMRRPDNLTLEISQPMLRSISAKLIDLIGEASFEQIKQRKGRSEGSASGSEAAIPPPPPPPEKDEKKEEKK